MPAKSKSQQKAAGMALAAKRGDMPVSDLQGAAKDMYDSMSASELEDFAETEHEGLPNKVEETTATLDQSLIKTAMKRGAAAAKKRKRRAPLMDPKFVKMVPDDESSTTSPYFAAWLKGYDMERSKNESLQAQTVRQIIREEVRRMIAENEDTIHQDIAAALRGVKDSKGKPVRYSIETAKRGNRGEIIVKVWGNIDAG